MKNNHKKTLRNIKIKKDENLSKKEIDLKKAIKEINSFYDIKLFDSQILGALALIDGGIIDMKTGEGKTYSGLLASIMLVKNKRKVSIVSANDYLCERDFHNSVELYKSLGISASVVNNDLDFNTKKMAYKADVIFSTASQLGFDYLTDIHAFEDAEKLHTHQDVAIIDEADSVMLDQSSMPLIKSKEIQQDVNLFILFDNIANNLKIDVDFKIDLESKKVTITEDGYKALEDVFLKNNLIKNYTVMYSGGNTQYINFLTNAIRAKHTMEEDVDYMVRDNQVLAIDPQTQRVLPSSQRWSNGLHQAIEAKEQIQPLPELGVESSISIQNYFRTYKKISAMSGTAKIDKDEFKEVYNLDLTIIKENKENKRIVNDDLFFINIESKNKRLVEITKEKVKTQQPILIATTNTKESELVSSILRANGIEHKLINAKNPEVESAVIENAGLRGSVTVATNMAGRGTDIKLGAGKKSEHDEIIKLGGLFVLGYGRSELRRVDEQLSGRCARQGDIGEVQFLMSLDDPLADGLPKNQIIRLFSLLGISETEGVYNSKISHSFYTIQNRKEQQDLEIRKNMLMYDDILQKQRKIYYNFRDRIYYKKDLSAFYNNTIKGWVKEFIEDFLYKTSHIEENKVLELLKNNMVNVFQIEIPFEKVKINQVPEVLENGLIEKLAWLRKKAEDSLLNISFEKYMQSSILYNLDTLWSEHFQAAETLKSNVAVRTTAQKNPFEEFSNESFDLFKKFTNDIPFQIVMILMSSSHLKNFSPIKTNEENPEMITTEEV